MLQNADLIGINIALDYSENLAESVKQNIFKELGREILTPIILKTVISNWKLSSHLVVLLLIYAVIIISMFDKFSSSKMSLQSFGMLLRI